MTHHCEPGSVPAPPLIQQVYQHGIALEQMALELEAEEHADLILVPNLVDTYGGLPKKLKEGLRWMLQHTTTDWFMKIDDDVAVRLTRVEQALSSYNKDSDTIIGKIHRGGKVPLDGKWAEVNYKSKVYPTFPMGGECYVVSRRLSQRIVDHDGFEYQGEDVSLGIWIEELEAEFQQRGGGSGGGGGSGSDRAETIEKDGDKTVSQQNSNAPWKMVWEHASTFGSGHTDADCYDMHMLTMGHNLSPRELRQCFPAPAATASTADAAAALVALGTASQQIFLKRL